MPQLNKHWQIDALITPETDQALSSFPPILRRILCNRGYSSQEAAQRSPEAALPEGTDPYSILGVRAAVDRLQWALNKDESIAIYGDYDADGVTATALLVQVLQGLGAQVRGYIPNRFDEGYGVNIEALDHLKADGVKIVITVDCGVRSLNEAEYAQKIGLDLIISDHHHPAKVLPSACAFINPQQPRDMYPEKDLAGVGLAYKLAVALLTHLENTGKTIPEEIQPINLLDLVALGTVADLAPLRGENRSLVRAGLEAIRQPRRQGLLSLIGSAGLNANRVTAGDIGFILGPRLNAAGRLDSALAAFHLLTTQDLNEAGRLAQALEAQNYERQRIMREIQAAAEQLALAEEPEPMLLFAVHPEFNSGVVGLAASRLTDLYYRPAIVAQKGEEYTRGSCRSIPEFHITEALDQCADLLEHHGGHAAAAGFTVHNRNLPDLVERLKAIAKANLSDLNLKPTLHADIEIPLSDLKPEMLNYLDMLQPTGNKNPQAVFVSRNLRTLSARTVGKENAHLKLVVSDGRITYDAIAFRFGHWFGQLPKEVDLMYIFELNVYSGREYLQLRVVDLKPAGTPD